MSPEEIDRELETVKSLLDGKQQPDEGFTNWSMDQLTRYKAWLQEQLEELNKVYGNVKAD